MLKEKDGGAVIKAFKVSLEFEQLQLDFARPTFEYGK